MATVPDRIHNSAIGVGYERWIALVNRLRDISLWLVVVAYALVYAMLLVAAASAALYLGTTLPGVAGALVFFTGGLVLIAAAPAVARGCFLRALEAYAAQRD